MTTENRDCVLEKLVALARSFPTLDGAIELDYEFPMDRDRFIDWLENAKRTGTFGKGAGCAAEFCLHVFSGRQNKFDMYLALSHWDEDHVAAFQAWAADPYYL